MADLYILYISIARSCNEIAAMVARKEVNCFVVGCKTRDGCFGGWGKKHASRFWLRQRGHIVFFTPCICLIT